MEAMTDVRVENHSSVFLFRLFTDEAREWVEENVGGDTDWFGGALVVEHRFARDLADGMVEAGLSVE